jgi:hypothetical protein
MKTLRCIAVLHFILLLFLGNVGVRVFTHSCKEDGTFKSYFVELKNHCNDEGKSGLPPCCQRKFDGQPVQQLKEDCCESDVDVFKIKNSFNHQKVNFEKTLESSPVFSVAVLTGPRFQRFELHTVKNNLRPPPLSRRGKDIIIQYQVFRI